MAKWAVRLGTIKSRNPSAIANDQHDDKSLSARNVAGSPGSADFIIPDSTVATVVPDFGIIRVVNTTAAVHYLYIGLGATIPGGAPTILTGYAIPPNSYENFFLGDPDDMKEAIWIKSSNVGVQVIVFEQ